MPAPAGVFSMVGILLSTSYAGGVPFKEITVLLGQSSPGETERYVHRLPDQTLAQRTRAAIDHAFPAGPVSPAQHGADQAGAVFSSGVCGWACRRCGLGGLKRGPACGPDNS